MARARNIKPGLFQNDMLGELSPLARLVFIGMWTIADFKGCIEFRPKMMKVQLLPYDNCDIEALVNSLEQARFIRYYSVQEKRYIKIVNFEKHQNPHKNERDAGSEIPDIPKDNNINDLTNDGTKTDLIGTARADSLFPLPSTLIPEPTFPIPDATALTKTGAAFALPDWIDADDWRLWVSVRKKMNDEQKQRQVKKLEKWKNAGLDYRKALSDAADNSWQGLVEPTGRANGSNRPQTVQESRLDCINQIMGNRHGHANKIIDISASGSDSSDGASVPKIDGEVWKPDGDKMARLKHG